MQLQNGARHSHLDLASLESFPMLEQSLALCKGLPGHPLFSRHSLQHLQHCVEELEFF